jgi:hypothetical protein
MRSGGPIRGGGRGGIFAENVPAIILVDSQTRTPARSSNPSTLSLQTPTDHFVLDMGHSANRSPYGPTSSVCEFRLAPSSTTLWK